MAETIEVLITSIDGNLKHPFRREQTVDDVRRLGYDKLVRDKAQIPFESTWIEFAGKRQDGAIRLSALVPSEGHEKKHETDLTLNLAWTQQGG